VKGWGKSPPRRRQRRRHGKPRLEQDRIGTSRELARRVHRPRRPGRSREPSSNGRSRGMIVAVLRGGTEPGLQAVWRFTWAYRPSGCLRLILRGLPAFGLLEARCLPLPAGEGLSARELGAIVLARKGEGLAFQSAQAVAPRPSADFAREPSPFRLFQSLRSWRLKPSPNGRGVLTPALKTWRKERSTGCEYSCCCLYVLFLHCVTPLPHREFG